MKIRIAIGLALLCGSFNSLRAQPVPVQQFSDQQQKMPLQQPLKAITTSTNAAPELYPGENDDVGPQAILKLNARRTLFDVVLDTQYAWTDNNRLADTDKIDTGLTINTVQFALAPSAYPMGSGQFAPKVGVRSQWYNYGIGGQSSEKALDFNAQTAFAMVQYQYNQKWQFDAEFDYTRLVDQRDYNEFYVEFTPGLAVQRFFALKPNLLLVASWQGMYHFTTVDPFPREDVNDRLDNTLGLTLAWQPVNKLVVQPFYRLQHTYYPRTALGDSRSDVFNIFGVAVNYNFLRQLSGRVFVTETFRESDDPTTTDYNKLDAGIGASLILRF